MPLSFVRTRACIFFRRTIAFMGREFTTEEGSSQVAESHPLFWQAVRCVAFTYRGCLTSSTYQSLVARLSSISAYSTGNVVCSLTGY